MVDNHNQQSTIVYRWVLHVSMSFMPLITATDHEGEVKEKKDSQTQAKTQKDESPFQYACYPLNPCA
jgi:hypothetical protein